MIGGFFTYDVLNDTNRRCVKRSIVEVRLIVVGATYGERPEVSSIGITFGGVVIVRGYLYYCRITITSGASNEYVRFGVCNIKV